MHKAGVERGFAENVKIDVGRSDFLCACDACVKEFGIHERACCLRLASARAKAAMQVADICDFYINAVHDSSFTASLYSLSLPAFLIFLNIFFGMFGSRYSQKLWMCESIWLSPWNFLHASSKMI